MKAKEYLSQIPNIHTKIQNKKERVERLRCILESPGVQSLSDDRVQTSISTDKMERMIAEKARLEDELQSLMYEEAVLIIRIGKQIDEMENPTYSRILHLRYEENMQFIDISRMIGQTHKYTCNLHGKALDDFSKMYLEQRR